MIRAWNLGLIEFLYLIPVNAIILWLAFRTKKRPNAGILAALAGLLYAPVRFFLDFLRPEETDPRHLGLTFAQWASILAVAVAGYVLFKFMKHGEPADIVAPTAGDAQRQLKMVLKEEAAAAEKQKKATTGPGPARGEAPSEAEDKAAKADATEGDEGVDDPAAPPGKGGKANK
jgi:hypothetical protein